MIVPSRMAKKLTRRQIHGDDCASAALRQVSFVVGDRNKQWRSAEPTATLALARNGARIHVTLVRSIIRRRLPIGGGRGSVWSALNTHTNPILLPSDLTDRLDHLVWSK
jgi:hypothetical protein